MCGIAALFQTKPSLSAGTVNAMADLIAHRGPDGEGYVLGNFEGQAFFRGLDTPPEAGRGTTYEPGIKLPADNRNWQWAMGHRRLSIIDLSATGHQPMSDWSGRLTISYNGEVYNYLELRHELEKSGHRFVGNSDTEVVLAAFAQWGNDCLHRFNGMFAFVLIDRRNSQVLIARDRFGVKPLYIRRSHSYVAVASEIKQFSVLPDWTASVEWQRAHDFLLAGVTDHTSQTLFAGVEQLPPGHYISAPLDALALAKPQTWYSLSNDVASVQPLLQFDAAAERFAHLFADSVRLRLRADVPVGTALSGGLDSSAIVCEVRAQLAEMGRGVQKSFSVCSPHKAFDERRFIDIVSSASGVEAFHVYPDTSTLLRELPELVWHQDEPFAGTSIFAEWEVYKLARANAVKVTLDGHGADEMLCGYHPFFWIYLNNLLHQGKFGTWIDEIRALKSVHRYKLSTILRAQAVALLPSRWLDRVREFSRSGERIDQLLACSNTRLESLNNPQILTKPWRNDVINESIRQFTNSSVPVQLHWADRDSMAHSVESRLPFLDYRLVSSVIACPADFKLGQGTTKRLLRRGVAHRLPPQILQRQDKVGFITPEQIWLCTEQGAYFSSWLLQRVDIVLSIISPASLKRALRILSGEERYSRFAWRVISMVMWAERFSVRGIQC